MTGNTVTGIVLAPLLPSWLTIAIAGLMLALVLVALVRRMPGTSWRGLFCAALVLVLLNPSLVEEHRETLPDIALVLVDRSPSQAVAGRPGRTERAVAALAERAARLADLEVRIAEVGPAEAAGGDRLAGSGTNLFGAIRNALADVPHDAVSGIVLVTDGAVHDVPESIGRLGLDAPVHALITGVPGEIDRRLELVEAPRYGVVDRPVSIVFRVHDSAAPAGIVPVTLTAPDGRQSVHSVQAGRRHEVRVLPGHAGLSVVRLDVEVREDELTEVNNTAVLAINGVRENLKVLLISGEVHTGERVWRNTLKADPSVELVHFTILRPPEKQDGTPIRELSLISFPVRELFEVKLDDFDLIIFDRYRKRGIIPEIYLHNIADYVLEGGAMMVAAGPDFATQLGLHTTVLGDLMPALPSGDLLVTEFRAGATDAGRRHPVTAGLDGIHDDLPPWGRWFRQVDAEADSGDVLLTGIGERPLLIVQRAGEGRVAQLMSDHLWLWSRGYDGGGPSQELLRRTAHWLMKEPDLEENALVAAASGDRITIVRQSMEDRVREVRVTAPSGAVTPLTLEPGLLPGRARAELAATETGLYRIGDGEFETLVSVGALNPPEWRDPRATAEALGPLVEASGGGLSWIAEDPIPTIRRVSPGRDSSGNGWIGMLDHGRYIVRGIESLALLPPWLALLLLIGSLAAAWRMEGR